MWLFNSPSFRCLTLLLVSIYMPSAYGQCSTSVGCIDCFNWCPLQTAYCNVSFLQLYCRKSCQSCSPESLVCKANNCSQQCILSKNLQIAKCSCFKGYRLQADEITCKDIDECAENPNICKGIAPICVNIKGSYTCSPCFASGNRITNYYSDPFRCCSINTASTCGKTFNKNIARIIYGIDDSIRKWPWQVYINTDDRLCGGSLITENYVLTAGQCVGNLNLNGLSIVAGVYNVTGDGSIFQQTFKPKKIYRHPNYSFPNSDIAIIQLDHPAILNDYVNTICLPGDEEPKIGETCYATGYGLSMFRSEGAQVLQEVGLPIVNTTMCQETYKYYSYHVIPDIHMCAGFTTGGKDTYRGDMGGPLVCQRCNNCDWYIAGITSWGGGCARAGFYGVYTRVTAFESWITGITNQTQTNKQHLC